MKIDLEKAFDSVQWPFILSILKVMGFPEMFVNWISKCISTASFSVQFNGELVGFFGSSRGFRQGCSLSPFLFVICMNILSKMIDRAALRDSIGYHPQCKITRLTHLCFADDLLVFTDGRKSSIEGLVEVLNEFSQISGLKANMEKSTIFVAGMSEDYKKEIKNIFPFAEGNLPVKYVGLPLITRSMKKEDYALLVERIRSKFHSWTTRFLSYAGRRQLISSVIYSITNFWLAMFPLPSACLNEIEGLCAAFLWDGPNLNTMKVKVSWKQVCYPQQEGGLGFRRLREVKTVSCLKLIWRIVSQAESFWVEWVQNYLLKGSSFWIAKARSIGSWIYKKLFKLRDLAKAFHKAEIVSGNQISFWNDIWSERGRLYDLVGPRGVIEMGVSENASVKDAKENFRRRNYRYSVYADIQEALLGLRLIGNTRDKHLWRKNQNDFGIKFTTSSTWNMIRQKKEEVIWAKNVWFKGATPKCAFIHWLAYLNRLSTHDQIRVWNPGINTQCLLCSSGEESRDHLFFECCYSLGIWRKLMLRILGRHFQCSWIALSNLDVELRRDKDRMFLFRYGLQVALYTIWLERNKRKHGIRGRSIDNLTDFIRKQVTNRLTVLRREGNFKYGRAMEIWLS